MVVWVLPIFVGQAIGKPKGRQGFSDDALSLRSGRYEKPTAQRNTSHATVIRPQSASAM